MRGAKVAVFSVNPSPKDFEDANNEMANQIDAFKGAEKIHYCLSNSDNPERSFNLFGRYELPAG